ncbi:hypothetical protein U0039_07140 [Stenotrophomonas maltophilia]|jgi:hypothetical protein|uniref:Uncharacterized protein n=3 Tax=Gammaproteobacteria TaxID=1236 RepID=A0A2R3Q2X7_STEMA|nr:MULTISPECIES: hypothetical protein [Stenotrophomonas]MCV4211481.1 hypothetical protein [Pseudomonas cichorii]AVO31016.1 hypothetical protein C6Y55_14360 [Stenotrophomonas maltophilia]EKU9957085.1 hypothetical protein [Stenotrophomonas maltophilia]EKU9983341.1 hypothetical protein [Stenotrophomonas maltophilia]ELK2667072.1 hypothetical protein [Stenotrophomonas maltophilia]
MFLIDIQPVMMWERSPSTCQTVYGTGKIAGSLTGGNWMSDTTYSHRILKTYGLLVDFEGKPRLKNVPSPLTGQKKAKETMEKWTQRVLGDEVSKVRVYRPARVKSDTLIASLTDTHDAKLVRDIVRGAVRKKSKSAKAKIEEIKVEHAAELRKRGATARELRKAHEEDLSGKLDDILAATAYLPLDDLQDLVVELGEDLSPSVRNWALALAPAKDADEVSVIDVLKQMLLRMDVLSKNK